MESKVKSIMKTQTQMIEKADIGDLGVLDMPFDERIRKEKMLYEISKTTLQALEDLQNQQNNTCVKTTTSK